ncbi:hypothetical protein GCM10025881_14750 [Pseudolysinimonas kribbensis]|uniref:Uncharacterized protein n=1 Tax=Pseudolysinimonas kribbensis TaxID=433641 RepID=A0ABQ6K4K8_9MICO|nr:hypothetical protein GCM10025881_14750 [Pseudolysinimonas kribbensis]
MLDRPLRQQVADPVEQADEVVRCGCQLQHEPGVHDVLGGGAEMRRAARGRWQQRVELPDEGRIG